MAIETINVGTSPNDGLGDPLRSAFQKANTNFLNITEDGGNEITVTDPTTSTDADLNDALQNIFDSGGGTTPTLQEVTDAGASTDKTVRFKLSETTYIEINSEFQSIVFWEDVGGVATPKSGLSNYDLFIGGYYATDTLSFVPYGGGLRLNIEGNEIVIGGTGITYNGNDYPLPTGASSQIATLADIPTINERFKGAYTSESALETAHPTANVGDYATVDTGSGSNAVQYIWDAQEGWVASGSISPSTTDALPEGTTNLYFSVARVLASALTGISFSDGSDVTAANTVLQALGKLQKQLTDVRAAKQDKTTVFKNTTQTVVTGTTGEVIIYAEEVLANTLSDNTILSFKSRFGRNPRVNTCALKLYLNTVNNLSGSPVAIAQLTIPVNVGAQPFIREQIFIKDNVLSVLGSSNSASDVPSGGGVFTTSTYNINTTYYWILTAQPNTSTDSLTHNFSILEKK